MTQEKIDWYQEVLELDPGSKVFFPLAQLLADNQDVSQAVVTLQRGLRRHPEYIEARLFLVEILFKYAGQPDVKALLDAQLELLMPALSRYAGFWKAWSAATKNDDSDTSLALNFLAMLFQNQNISVSDIFSKGLEALSAAPHTVAQKIVPAKPAHHEEEYAQEQDAKTPLIVTQQEENPAYIEPAPSFQNTENEAISEMTPAPLAPAPLAPDNTGQEQSQKLYAQESDPLNSQLSAAPENDNSYKGHRLDENFAGIAQEAYTENTVSEQIPTATPKLNTKSTPKITLKLTPKITPISKQKEEPVENIKENNTSKETLAPTADNLITDKVPAEAQAVPALAEEDEHEERFSLRTRSMAEVLAEQSDYQGALEIYNELVNAASSPEEERDLQHRITTLNALVGEPQEKIPAQNEQSSFPGKDRVLSVLETLAERLENRAS